MSCNNVSDASDPRDVQICEEVRAQKISVLEKRIYESAKDAIKRMNTALDFAKKQCVTELWKSLPTELNFDRAVEAKNVTYNEHGLEIGVIGLKGIRHTMEDEHLVTLMPLKINGKKVTVPVFGVFDGHLGSKCSNFVSHNAERILKEKIEFYNRNGFTPHGILSALKMAMVYLDIEYNNTSKDKDGTTAAMALIMNGYVYVVNTGDSRTILQNDSKSLRLSEDATASNPRFVKSVKKRGGVVVNYSGIFNGPRIAHNDYYFLEPARTIGDSIFKGAVSPRPKVSYYPLKKIEKGNATLVLACDGLFDVASTSQVCSAVRFNRKRSAADLAAGLAQTAIDVGSKDNVSVIVVKIQDKEHH